MTIEAEGDIEFHLRRVLAERLMSLGACDRRVAMSHAVLAEMHEVRADALTAASFGYDPVRQEPRLKLVSSS